MRVRNRPPKCRTQKIPQPKLPMSRKQRLLNLMVLHKLRIFHRRTVQRQTMRPNPSTVLMKTRIKLQFTRIPTI